MFRIAAVALIQPDDVPARRPRLVGDSADVMGKARALEPVQEQQRRMIAWLVVPVAMRKDACIVGNIEEAGRGRRQARKPSRFRPRIQRLQMAAGKARMVIGWLETH